MSAERTAELRRWIESATGGEIQRLERRPGGGSHQAYAVELRDGRARRSCFLRFDEARPKPWNPYSLQREAEVYRALAGTGVPVADVLAVAPEMQAVLLTA